MPRPGFVQEVDRSTPPQLFWRGENFSLEAIAPKYEKYFREALYVTLDKGWYTIEDPELYTKKWVEKMYSTNRGKKKPE